MKNAPRVSVVGFDGGTWDLLKPWMQAGLLPNLARLEEQGSTGVLSSTIPPWTPTAWSSFATGKNPGKHGVFGFSTRTTDGSIRWVSSKSIRTPTLWRILSDNGLRVGLLNVPLTYPPEDLNGFVVSGFPTPPNAPDLSAPRELFEELRAQLGDYVVDMDLDGVWGRDVPEREALALLERLEQMTRKRCAALSYLLERYPTDFLMVVFVASDRIQHMFWKYLDPAEPLYHRPEAPRYRDRIMRSYALMDQSLGQLLDLTGEDGYVFLVSDHGFGPRDKLFLMNKWLRHQHLQKQQTAKALLKSVSRRLGLWNRKGLSKMLPEGLKNDPCIDWRQTQAHAGSIYESGIYLDLGEAPDRGALDGLRGRLTDELTSLRDNETGAPVIKRVLRREEVFSGPFVSEGPDVVLCPNKGYYPVDFGSRPFEGCLRKVAGAGGDHREEGIVACYGPGTTPGGRLESAHIMDLAPTILYVMGLPVPDDMDGRVLSELFEEELLARNPVRQCHTTEPRQEAAPDDVYSADDAEAIYQRLKAIGYVG